jgi:hypothetical protein
MRLSLAGFFYCVMLSPVYSADFRTMDPNGWSDWFLRIAEGA